MRRKMEVDNSEKKLKADIESIQQIPIIPTLLDVICRTTGMRFAAVARVTQERWITCSVHDEILFGLTPGDELKVETTICHEIRQSKQAVIIDHVDKDENFCKHHTPAMYGFQSYISVPIFRKNGDFFGTLCALDPKPAKLSTPEVTGMFNLFSDLISFHLQAIEQLEQSELKLSKEREEKAKALEQKNTELQKKNAELESFAYVASHDLQEPLRKIQTFSSRILYKDSDNLSEDSKVYFSRINKSVKRMNRLIEDLFTYTQVNEDERRFQNTDLNGIVEEIKKDYKEDIDRNHVTIEIGDMCSAYIIPFQFYQLFQNMLENSIKYSRPGVDPVIQIEGGVERGDISINDRLLPGEKYCHIIISDNGIGFEPEYSEKIFKVFQRLHGREEYNGTGIGLAIVKKIVDNHNGFITATAEINKGARFDIFIPQS